MKVALTGGSGQLGTLLLRRLIDDRKIKGIVSLDLRPPALVSGKLRHVQADVRDSGLEAHFAGCDALVHLAFLVTQLLPRATFDAVNVEGSKNVFRAAAAAGVQHLVYASSVAAYGIVPGHPVPIVESTPRVFQPDFPYPACKYLVEEFLDGFEREHPALLVTRLRPTALIGMRMPHQLGRALLAGFIPDLGGADLPLVWDEDVADAFVLALKKRIPGAFLLTAEPPASALDLARASGLRRLPLPRTVLGALARVSPWLARAGLGPTVDPQWIAHADVAIVPSSARARAELGWTPRCPASTDVLRRLAETAPGRGDLSIGAFVQLTRLASWLRPPMNELHGVEARVHLCLTGPGGGDFTFSVKDRKLGIRPGIPRPPTSVATLPASLFKDLLAGRADFSSSQFTGRVRIEGDPFAGFLLNGLVTMFRTQAAAPGLRGLGARAFSKWLGQGGMP